MKPNIESKDSKPMAKPKPKIMAPSKKLGSLVIECSLN